MKFHIFFFLNLLLIWQILLFIQVLETPENILVNNNYLIKYQEFCLLLFLSPLTVEHIFFFLLMKFEKEKKIHKSNKNLSIQIFKN